MTTWRFCLRWLLYANAFLGEFVHHGVIQAKLERALRQGRTVLHGGVPFDVTHAAFDVSRLLKTRSRGSPATT